MAKTIEIFISYVRKDEKLLDMLLNALEGPLKPLKQQGLVSLWHERDIQPGAIASLEVQKHLRAAHVILLLISADFIAMDFCYSEEMMQLTRRHQAGEVCLIPILLRETYWQEAPFGGFQPLPDNGEAVNSWENKDRAFLNVAKGVKKVIDELIALKSIQLTDTEEGKSVTNTTFTHGYALLIGVGNDLPVTVKDATALYDLFTHPARAGYPPSQVSLLTEEQASRKHILAEFERFIQRVNNDPEATAIVYFSGHGGMFRASDQTTPKYFLVPYGYDPKHYQKTTISDQEFTICIEAIKARKLIVLLDCCHAGGIPLLKNTGAIFEKSPIPPSLLQTLQTGRGHIVIASSREKEDSLAGTPYSVFTACLIEALNGKAAVKKDGMVHILEVLTYLFEQIPLRTKDKQHPFVNKVLNMDENFSLCYYAGGNKKVPGELVPDVAIHSSSTLLTPGKRSRLETEREQKQNLWELHNEKIQRLQNALAIDTEPLTRFKHEKELLQAQTELQQVADELDAIEQLLQ